MASAKPSQTDTVPLQKPPSPDFENDFSYGTSVATSSPTVRLAFIRKVYGILAAQLSLTVVLCALFMFVPPLRRLALSASVPLTIVATVGTFATLFALIAKKDSYPLNLQLLAAFTVSESVLVGTVCAMYAASGLSYLVFEALVITLAIFGGITLYAFTSKRDFSFMGGALYAALLAFIACSFFNLFLGVTGNKSPALAFAMSWGGSVLFSLYILYDSMFYHLRALQASLCMVLTFFNFLPPFFRVSLAYHAPPRPRRRHPRRRLPLPRHPQPLPPDPRHPLPEPRLASPNNDAPSPATHPSPPFPAPRSQTVNNTLSPKHYSIYNNPNPNRSTPFSFEKTPLCTSRGARAG